MICKIWVANHQKYYMFKLVKGNLNNKKSVNEFKCVKNFNTNLTLKSKRIPSIFTKDKWSDHIDISFNVNTIGELKNQFPEEFI